MDSQDAQAAAAQWVRRIDEAVRSGRPEAVIVLLDPDAYWRDVLALTWDLHTYYGAAQIAGALGRTLEQARPCRLLLDRAMPPRLVSRAGREVAEVVFTFETDYGPGRGVASLDA